jgi:hypothetical protein
LGPHDGADALLFPRAGTTTISRSSAFGVSPSVIGHVIRSHADAATCRTRNQRD